MRAVEEIVGCPEVGDLVRDARGGSFEVQHVDGERVTYRRTYADGFEVTSHTSVRTFRAMVHAAVMVAA